MSTLFAARDLLQDCDLFYSHMGHTEQINKVIYKAQSAMLEVTSVVKHLLKMDAEEDFFIVHNAVIIIITITITINITVSICGSKVVVRMDDSIYETPTKTNQVTPLSFKMKAASIQYYKLKNRDHISES